MSSVPLAQFTGRYRSRKIMNSLGTGLAVGSLLLALIPLGAMLGYVLAQGGASLNLNFFTQQAYGNYTGMANAIVGTLELVALASCIGLPMGILSGIYLARSRPGTFTRTVRFVADVVAGTPSIIAGIVAYALVVVPMGHFSAYAGAAALALLMFPTVARATEESIRLVPDAVREAGLALGLPEWKTMFRIILPAATTGIVTAVMLGISRVAGETAPLLFTAVGNDSLQYSPNGLMGSLPQQIWKYASSPVEDWHRQAWAGAFTLFCLVLVLNLSARMLTARMSARVGKA